MRALPGIRESGGGRTRSCIAARGVARFPRSVQRGAPDSDAEGGDGRGVARDDQQTIAVSQPGRAWTWLRVRYGYFFVGFGRCKLRENREQEINLQSPHEFLAVMPCRWVAFRSWRSWQSWRSWRPLGPFQSFAMPWLSHMRALAGTRESGGWAIAIQHRSSWRGAFSPQHAARSAGLRRRRGRRPRRSA